MFVGLISLEEGGRNFPWELKSVASQLHQIRRVCSGLPSNCLTTVKLMKPPGLPSQLMANSPWRVV